MMIQSAKMFSVNNVIGGTPYLFMAVLFVFAFSIILKSGTMFSIQLLLFIAMSAVNMTASPVVYAFLGVVELILSVFVLYRFFKAIDYNYQLILEKTHQIPRNITRNGFNGARKSFL